MPTGRGPRPGGGGRGGRPGGDGPHWFGDDGWFGGTRVHPPKPPKGGAPVGLFEPPPLPEVEEPAWDSWVGDRPAVPEAVIAPVAPAGLDIAAPETPALPAPPAAPALAFAAPAELDALPPAPALAPPPAAPQLAFTAPAELEAGPPAEAVVPTVVVVRATGALDAAAMDAAEAAPADRRPQGPPSGGRTRRPVRR